MSSLLLHGARLLDARGGTGQGWLLCRDGVVVERGSGEDWRRHPALSDPAVQLRPVEGTITPGLIDAHCHGGGGAAYGAGPEQMLKGLAAHAAHGTAFGVISLVSSTPEEELRQLREVAALAQQHPAVLGSHLEGPFLAEARKGAHDPLALAAPDAERIAAQLEAAAGTLRQVTLAPELPGAFAAIEQYRAAGVIVAVGHTEADYDLARSAFDAGARMLTHAFNAMPGVHHRAPGPVLAALEDERVTLELIWDGRHVHDALAAWLLRSAPGRVALITDAMAAAAGCDGHYHLGSLEVQVRDSVATVAGTETLAGSTLTQDAALRRALGAGIAPEQAIAALTAAPAGALGLAGSHGLLEPGHRLPLALWDPQWRFQGMLGEP